MKYLLDGESSERLVFRKLKPDDHEVWLKFFKHPLSDKYWLSDDRGNPEALCRRWFESTFQRYSSNQGGMNVLIDKLTGTFIGQCGLLVQHVDDMEELEVGYSIMPDYWNKGYATEAARKCILHAFDHDLRESLISIIHERNIESEKVALKNKMKLDKRTIYSDNPVKIFRIAKQEQFLITSPQ